MTSIQAVLNLYKKVGETPLGRIDRFRVENPAYTDAVLSYAGRLDPMAEGVLLVVVGDENKDKEKYLNLPKKYTFECLWGFETDTYDVLGKVKEGGESEKLKAQSESEKEEEGKGGEKPKTKNKKEKIDELVKNLPGKFSQKYPPYSSKTVQGVPLFEWARKGKLEEIEIPSRDVEIFESKTVGEYILTKKELEETILKKISLVRGDFRQGEIKELWLKTFANTSQVEFQVTSMWATVSGGVYIRSIVQELGKKVGRGAVTLGIMRDSVGDFLAEDSVR